jgi:hypothetical protein
MMPASAAPTLTAPHAPREEHTTQLAALYADTAGFIVLACIDGDPRPNCGGIYDQQVFRWPSERHHVEQQARAWAERGLNVYCSLVVLRGKQRTYAHALDSPWIWLDDLDHVPADAAMAVETSPGNFQVYWKLNEALGARERAALQRQARAYYAVDACSADAVHLVRLAGGYNRKRHGMFKVRLVRHTNSTVTRAELEARWPKPDARDDIDPIALDQEQLALWNSNLRALLSEQNLPRRWKNPHIPARRVLRGELAAHDRSTQRYIVVKSLLLHGYPDAEIATLAAALTDNGHSREKGTDWLYLDIARCIAKAEQELAREGRARRVTPTLPVPHRPPLPVEQLEPPRRRGRPIGGRARKIARLRTMLMERAEDDSTGRIYYYVDDLAEALGASRRSTQEYLAELEAGGELRRGQDGHKNMAWIELSPACYERERGANNSATALSRAREASMDEASARSANNSVGTIHGVGEDSAECAQERSANNSIDAMCSVAQDSANYVQERSANNAPCRVVEACVDSVEERSASNSDEPALQGAERTTEQACERCAGDAAIEAVVTPETAIENPSCVEEHTCRGVPPSPQISLSAAVAEAFDAYGGNGRPLTRRRIVAYIVSNYPHLSVQPATLERCIAAERTRRQRARKLAALATLAPAGLRAELRLAEHLADRSKAQGTRAWRWWACYRDQARRELAQRPPSADHPSGGRKNCEQLPDLHTLGQHQQAMLWALADEALSELRAERRGCRRLRACVPPLPAPILAQAPSVDAAGLIARLKARREAE